MKIGGDAALMKGFIKTHIQKGQTDVSFIKNSTRGYEAMCQQAIATSWKEIVRDTGLDREVIESVGALLASSNATIACWAMGLTQQPNGVAVIQEVVNLLLMGGHVGKPGAGFCPVRGHSNVQGDRTVGIWEAPSDAFLDRMEKGLGFPMPRKHGYDVVNAIRAMNKGKVSVFFCMGGNFLSATPDTHQTAKGLTKIDLTVQVSTKLNRSHLITGKTAIILPCLGRTEIDQQADGEQFVTVENSMGIVHKSTGGLKPASPDLMSEPAIVAHLATASLKDAKLDWMNLVNHYDGIRDLMAESLAGFERYNERVREPNGFALPNPPRDTRSFATDDGFAHFTAHALPDVSVPDDCYVMMTMRSHDQYNTTIYDVHDRYRGIHGNRRVVLMNATDMAKRGWKNRQEVQLTSHFDGVERKSPHWQLVAYDIPSGNIATYFPESNTLVPLDSTAAGSNTPTSKWIIVSIDDNLTTNRVHEEE
ncbi:molybdopterin-dependent oxidoreductase [Euryarchaeota archaeon]|nr:molybdopterin-dependent oxidoreductase [Euryarchaeota archaeon]